MSERAPRLHLNYLDGLRACAALYVVLHHCWESQGHYCTQSGWAGITTNWLLYGHYAVDLFIVLSGFCLILPVVRTGSLAGGIMSFYRRRAHRILPPFYATLLLCILLHPIMHWLNPAFPHLTKVGVLVNLLLMQDYFHTLSLDPPLWSVAAEWKIYFLFPLIIWLIQRHGMLKTLTVTAIMGYGWAIVLHWMRPEMWLFLTCPWYLFLFAMGVCAGLLSFGQKSQIPQKKMDAYGARVFFNLGGCSMDFSVGIPT